MTTRLLLSLLVATVAAWGQVVSVPLATTQVSPAARTNIAKQLVSDLVQYGGLATLAVGRNYRTASQFGALGGTNHDEVALQNGINWSATNHGVFVGDVSTTIGTNMFLTTNAVSGTPQFSDLVLPSGATFITLPGVTYTRDTNNVSMVGNANQQMVPFYSVAPDSNIIFQGGIWNCNSGVGHNTIWELDHTNNLGCCAMFFAGLSNCVIQGVSIQNSSYFGIMFANAIDSKILDYDVSAPYVADWSTYTETNNNDGVHLYDPLKYVEIGRLKTHNLNDNPISVCPGEQRFDTNYITGYTIQPDFGLVRYAAPNNNVGMEHVWIHDITTENSKQGIGFWGYPTFGNTDLSDFVVENFNGNIYSGGIVGGSSGGGVTSGGGCVFKDFKLINYHPVGGGARVTLLDDPANGGTITIQGYDMSVLPYEFTPDSSPYLHICASNVVINGTLANSGRTLPYLIGTVWTNGGGAVRIASNVSVNNSHLVGFDYLIGNSTNMSRLTISGLNGALPLTNSTASTYSGDGFLRFSGTNVFNITP